MIYKALVSSLLGFPIAYLINVTVLPVLNGTIHDNVYLASALLALPFILASWIRIYTIDLIYKKYKVRPLDYVKNLLKRRVTIDPKSPDETTLSIR